LIKSDTRDQRSVVKHMHCEKWEVHLTV